MKTAAPIQPPWLTLHGLILAELVHEEETTRSVGARPSGGLLYVDLAAFVGRSLVHTKRAVLDLISLKLVRTDKRRSGQRQMAVRVHLTAKGRAKAPRL